jgi:hypothetical protein
VAQDIEEFLKRVFIEKDAENIYLYTDLFIQNLEQLESNIQHVTRDADDGELDFF